MFPIKMRIKKTGASVDVYGFTDSNAICFDLGKYKNQNQGLLLISLGSLVPYDAYIKKENNIGTRSAKSRVKLVCATWICTDGQIYDCHDDAIEHETQIMMTDENYNDNKQI